MEPLKQKSLEKKLNNSYLEKIEANIEDFFKKMNWEIITMEVKEISENNFNVNLKMPNAHILIGKDGRVLDKIQFLLWKILQKKISKRIFIFLDINNYRKEKIENLTEIALKAAQETIKTKKEKCLPPMPAFLRRIIHIKLSALKGIKTKSIGEEPKRIIITFKP